jgi:tRNA(Ile)-lysidine synthase
MHDNLTADPGQIETVVRAAIERDRLLPAAGRVVVAVSSGADSLCLLGTLHALCGPGKAWPDIALVVAHLDHGLRGAAGQADAKWVVAHAARLGLPGRLGTADVTVLSRSTGEGVEAAARRARYAFLREVARAEAAERICVGHTRDDQVETLVLQWLRGSGLTGLGGMRPLAGDVARPLLDLARWQTEAYCEARGWTPRVDPTNADRRYRRNRVRHDLLPTLKEYNPNLAVTLARNARLLADDEDYLEERTADAWEAVVRVAPEGRVALDAHVLASLPAALRRRVLRRAAAQLVDGAPALEARHVAALEALVAPTAKGRALHLPAGLRARVEASLLVLERRQAPVAATKETRMGSACGAQVTAVTALPVPGCVAVPGTSWRVRAMLLEAGNGSPPPGAEEPWRTSEPAGWGGAAVTPDAAAAAEGAQLRAYVDADAASAPLYVRTWQPGDRFRPLGMAGEKKLQDYFVDAKVARSERQRIPLIWGPRHLLWVGGHRVDDRVRLTPGTQRVLALRLEPNGNSCGPTRE